MNKPNELNSIELNKKLFEMASNQTKYGLDVYPYIINAIMVHYMTSKDYFSDNAINTFKTFLESGALVW